MVLLEIKPQDGPEASLVPQVGRGASHGSPWKLMEGPRLHIIAAQAASRPARPRNEELTQGPGQPPRRTPLVIRRQAVICPISLELTRPKLLAPSPQVHLTLLVATHDFK